MVMPDAPGRIGIVMRYSFPVEPKGRLRVCADIQESIGNARI